MATSTPLREPPSAQTAFDESAMREPVEVLFKEARRRARRRRLIVAAAVAAVATVAAMTVTTIDGMDPPQDREAALGAAPVASPLGIFEPLRGRIVYIAGDELRGVDPTDPASVDSLALPEGLGTRPVVSGWSADGTRLALASEESGEVYVMDPEGGITRAASAMGCCIFVTDPWLSPDGTSAVEWVTAETLHLRNLESGGAPRVIELEPPVGDVSDEVLPVHAWAPDGTRIAYIADQQVGFYLVPSIHLVDLETGVTRELVGPGFGHVRHITWSPDGSRLLVIAGPWRATAGYSTFNPLTQPQQAGLYLVEADRLAPTVPASALNPIALGHYIAATWSPDGDRIAAIDFTDMGRNLVTMRADGSEARVVVDGVVPVLFTGLAWHPVPSGR